MTKWTFIFDADDTLWENQELFDHFEEKWAILVKEFGLEIEKARPRLHQLDAECYQLGKFGNVFFLSSMEKVFTEFLTSPEQAIRKVRELHDGIFLSPPKVFSEIPGVLETLKKKANLYLLTKGELSTQRRKIEQSGLEHHFNGFIVTSRKDVDTYRKLARQYALDPASTVMVGNSPKSDINPALNAGWWAIFYQRRLLWHLEAEELVETPRMFIIDNLAEIISIAEKMQGKP
ncbi:MAG: HAD family hydrolase [Candidatus Wallbacteria bacterium]|nr:HAD family hydrolase [Candidatus Wallbacteria bacterium]